MKQVAIVTGGSSGIGRSTALQLATAGYDVGITYRSGAERAAAVVGEIKRIGRNGASRHQDLAQPNAADAIDQLALDLGRLDAFVNNAGENRRCSFLHETEEGWSRSIAVNLTGAFLCAQRAARCMVKQGEGGRIVNVTSILDREVLEGGAAYCAGKAALRQLTRLMALELAPHNIRVNGVAPGETATPMNFTTEVDAASIARPVTPLARPGHSAEIASAIAFLLSEAANYMTGEVLLVDGGLALHGGPQSLQVAVGKPTPLKSQATPAVYPHRERP
jgi:NAD(P)-dependent dehydrogenase (short-subunit alcohol dehydrogenase family)